MAQVKTLSPATPGVFDLTAEHEAAVDSVASRGRVAQPSKYLDAVREAFTTGARRGVALVGQGEDEIAKHARYVGNDLRKAGVQLTREYRAAGKLAADEIVKVTTATRTDHPKLAPFVGFDAKTVKLEVTNVENDTQTPAS